MKTQNTTNTAHKKGAIITFNAETCYSEAWVILGAIGNPENPTAYNVAPYGRPNINKIKVQFYAQYLRDNEEVTII
jgi:hypothetical protein